MPRWCWSVRHDGPDNFGPPGLAARAGAGACGRRRRHPSAIRCGGARRARASVLRRLRVTAGTRAADVRRVRPRRTPLETSGPARKRAHRDDDAPPRTRAGPRHGPLPDRRRGDGQRSPDRHDHPHTDRCDTAHRDGGAHRIPAPGRRGDPRSQPGDRVTTLDTPTSAEAFDATTFVRSDRVHGSVYTSPEIFRREMNTIFKTGWVFVAHESEVSETGD